MKIFIHPHENAVDSYVATVVSIRDNEEERTIRRVQKWYLVKFQVRSANILSSGVTPRRYMNIV